MIFNSTRFALDIFQSIPKDSCFFMMDYVCQPVFSAVFWSFIRNFGYVSCDQGDAQRLVVNVNAFAISELVT